MSPIGRVFIVLNFAFAAGFVAVAGTHLQQQQNFKTLYEQEQSSKKAEVEKLTKQNDDLAKERNNFEQAKTANETEKGQLLVALAREKDDVKRLTQQNAEYEGVLKAQGQQIASMAAEIKSAFDQSASAFAKATADQATKDQAVRAKDAAETENRELKTTIANNEETIKGKDLMIAGLTKDKSELTLLVKVAEANGFKRTMAAPDLAGLVVNANERLCTIQITDNPGNIDINEQIQRGQWGFAIYDDNGYKGEAIATKYEASANAVLCNVKLVKGEFKQGDKASTRTP
jgi:hypothetical protein